MGRSAIVYAQNLTDGSADHPDFRVVHHTFSVVTQDSSSRGCERCCEVGEEGRGPTVFEGRACILNTRLITIIFAAAPGGIV